MGVDKHWYRITDVEVTADQIEDLELMEDDI